MKKTKEILQKALSCLDEGALVRLTKKLISIPSHHGLQNPEEEISRFLVDFLRLEGVDSELQTIEGERSNVIAKYGRNALFEKTLMLNGHMDTVSVENMTVDPFSGDILDRKIFGRGSVDMKGSLASMIYAVLAIKRAKIMLEGQVVFAAVADEEFWNLGTRHIVEHGPRTRYAIVGEPTELKIDNGHRALEWIEIAIKGRYCHGGTPERGINAIEKAGKLIYSICGDLLPSLHERTNPVTGPSTLNLGSIFGGTQPSTVAGECMIRLDRRWIPGESTESAMEELREVVRRLKHSDPDYEAEVRNMRNVKNNSIGQPPLMTDPDSVLVKSLERAVSEYVGPPELAFFPGWTDAGILSSAGGIETVVFGPGDLSSAHSDVEFCQIDQIIQSCKVYIATILDICL